MRHILGVVAVFPQLVHHQLIGGEVVQLLGVALREELGEQQECGLTACIAHRSIAQVAHRTDRSDDLELGA